MSPPLSKLERDDPPPRRKSCQACVKAKRRCDQRSPACLRCAQRKIRCQYPARPSRKIRPDLTRSPAPTEVPTTLQLEVQPGDTGQDETLLNATAVAQDLNLNEPPWFGDEAQNLQFDDQGLSAAEDPILSSQFADTSNLAFYAQEGIIQEADDRDDAEECFGFPIPGHSSTSMDLITKPSLELAAARRVDFAAATSKLDCKLAYAIDKIRAAPKTMVLENETPWSHPLLYKDHMPRVMQDSVSSCALYIAKNAVNAPVVMRCIDERVSDLLESRLPDGPLDTLARTQALLLYQIIRFFDGDILARSSADATFGELESSSFSLFHHISWNDDDWLPDFAIPYKDVSLPAFSLQPSRDFWKEWIYQQSARRTFLIASFFMNTWRALTGRPIGGCRDDPPFMRQSWSLSAHLWQARDAYDFSRAWKERKHYVVTRRTILTTLADAGRDDIEPFGKMLLTAALGVDEARAWLGMIGATL